MAHQDAVLADLHNASLDLFKGFSRSPRTHVMGSDAGEGSTVIRNSLLRSNIFVHQDVAKLVHYGDACESVVFASISNSNEFTIQCNRSCKSETKSNGV